MNHSFINELDKHRQDWLNIAASFVGDFYAEDIVNESYLKLIKYADENKLIFETGKINKSYMWRTLRSVSLELINKKQHKRYIAKEKDEPVDDVIDYDFVTKQEAIDNLKLKIEKEIDSWHWYDAKLFRLYRDTNMSFRTIAKETGISWVSIYNTIKVCKQIIKDKFSEDYEDLQNEDYHLI